MKSAVIHVAAAFLATVQGFDFPGVPACATSCLAPAITKAGCGINDQACQCGPTQSLIANYAVSCLLSSCDEADLMQAESAAVSGCSEYSATAGKTSATSTLTTASSATSVAQTSAQTTAGSSTSGVSSAVTSAPTVTSGSSSSIAVSSAAASTASTAPSSIAASNGTAASQTPAVVLSSDATMLVMSGSFVALLMAVVAVL